MRTRVVSLFVLLLLLNSTQIKAQDEIALNMEQCIELAIENNLGLKKIEYDWLSSREATKQVKADYEPLISISGGRNDVESSGIDPLYGTSMITDSLNLTLTKRFYQTGGSISLGWDNEKSDTNSIFVTNFGSPNPSYDSDITLSYSQPVLKNILGRNDRMSIRMSRMREDIANLNFTIQKNLLVNQIETTFLSLSFAKENLEAQRVSLERARRLLSINKKKLRDGLLEEVDVIATESAVTLREASLLLADDSFENAKDDLKRIVGINNDRDCNFIVEMPKDFKHEELVEEDITRKALSQRPDFKIVERSLGINALDRRVKGNNRLPSLDLVTSYGFGNSGESWEDNYDEIGEGENPTWYLGLNISLSPQNLRTRSLYKQSEYAHEKSKADYEDIKRAIVTECKIVTRRVNTQAKYADAALKSVKLQEKKLKLEEIKFGQGRSAIQWVLNYQDDLTNAEIEYQKALVDYYKAVSDLKLVTGDIR